MTWAVDNKHVGVIRLLEKSADDIEDVLLAGTREGNEELVKVALDRDAKPETLTVAHLLCHLPTKRKQTSPRC